MKRMIFLTLLLALLLPFAVLAQDDDGVSVTIYNQGTALVQDRRTFELDAGTTTINFTDVASGIDSTSVSFVSLTDPENTFVLEQNYVYDLVGAQGAL